MPDLTEAELRYPLVAAHLRARTSANAIVFAAQHSGSIRHYGDRLTLRWDLLRAKDFEPAVTALAERGHPIYVVLEGSEQGRFTSVFAARCSTSRCTRSDKSGTFRSGSSFDDAADPARADQMALVSLTCCRVSRQTSLGVSAPAAPEALRTRAAGRRTAAPSPRGAAGCGCRGRPRRSRTCAPRRSG